MVFIKAELESQRTSIGRNIEQAKTPETAIEIISAAECDVGLRWLQACFRATFSDPTEVSVVPILRSGARLGKELTKPLGITTNPMRMSYYAPDTSRLPKPICKKWPHIRQIITTDGRTRPVVFAECVVESQGTILASIQVINGMIDKVNIKGRIFSYPDYYTFAYVSKIGDHPITIPHLVAAFHVHPDVWVGGRWCDLPDGSARELDAIVGILSPFAQRIPQRPYFTRAF